MERSESPGTGKMRRGCSNDSSNDNNNEDPAAMHDQLKNESSSGEVEYSEPLLIESGTQNDSVTEIE